MSTSPFPLSILQARSEVKMITAKGEKKPKLGVFVQERRKEV